MLETVSFLAIGDGLSNGINVDPLERLEGSSNLYPLTKWKVWIFEEKKTFQ